MIEKVLIRAAAHALGGMFFRLGRKWTAEGVVVDRSEFTETDWLRLANEKMLHIGPVPEGVAAEVDAVDLKAAIKTAIAHLEPAEFDEASREPKLDAVRKLVARKGVTKALLAEVWAELTPKE